MGGLGDWMGHVGGFFGVITSTSYQAEGGRPRALLGRVLVVVSGENRIWLDGGLRGRLGVGWP
jgi:hypothetical protein